MVGVKGRTVKKAGKRVDNPSESLDQIHMPDPLSQEICKLANRLQHLENMICDIGRASSENSQPLNKKNENNTINK